MDYSGTIVDVKCLEGHIVAQIAKSMVYDHKDCILIVKCNRLGGVSSDFRIAADGKSIEWPVNDRRVTLSELFEHSNPIYFLKWSRQGWRQLPNHDEVSGCWRMGSGFVLLHHSGTVRFKIVGKGTTGDLTGDWQWTWKSQGCFEINRVDIPPDEKERFRQVRVMSRYDGKILETACWDRFHLRPNGYSFVQLWKREKLPKSWQKWA